MESRTGCDTSLSSPGKVGYLRTFTHRKQRRADTGRPLSPWPQQARLFISPEEDATNQDCASRGHHFYSSLEERLSLRGRTHPARRFWLPALVWMS